MASASVATAAAAAAADKAPAAAGGSAGAVVGPQHCQPTKTKLVMQAPHGSGDTAYHISDTSGRTLFMLQKPAPGVTSSFTSSGGKRTLLDAHGAPLVTIEKKTVSLHGTYVITRASDGARLAEVKPDWSLFKKTMSVYKNDGDKVADYTITGDKTFTVRDCARGNAVVAKLRRGSLLHSLPCVTPATAADAGKYSLKLQPGADAAFVAALALVCENVRGNKK